MKQVIGIKSAAPNWVCVLCANSLKRCYPVYIYPNSCFFFFFFSKANYDSWVHSVRHLFFPLTSDGTFKRFHAIHQSQRCTINDAPFPIAERREMKGGYGLHFESETLMRCEHWTCKNIHVHSLWEREHRCAAWEASASSAQWSLLSQTQHLTMFIPPAPSPQHHPPFLIYSFVNNTACDTRHSSHTGGLRSVFVRSRSCTGSSPDEAACRDTQHNNLFFFFTLRFLCLWSQEAQIVNCH